jgi:Glycosyl transferases group 1
VLEAWLPAPSLLPTHLSSDRWYREPDRWPATLMTIDPVERSHAVTEVIAALAGDSDLAGHARYVIAGRDDVDEAYVREVNATIAGHGLAASVRLLGHLLPSTLERQAANADVFVNVRDPNDEGCSASLMYELAHGKPVVVYDSGPFSEVPEEAVAKVPPGDRQALSRTLRELVHSPARREALGTAGRQFAASHSVQRYARELLEFAQAAFSSSLPDRMVTHIGELLASLAVQPDSDGLAYISLELSNLLSPTEG